MDEIKNWLINKYNQLTYTHSYIFGYAYRGIVYSARIDDGRALLSQLLYIDESSPKNGLQYILRYRPNRKQWQMICDNAQEVKKICTLNHLETVGRRLKKNRGETFELLVAQIYNGKVSDKCNLKFTNGGDMTINNVPYQVKYSSATFASIKIMKE